VNSFKEVAISLALPFAGAVAGWLARARNWFYPEDMKRSDGTLDPRAGRFNARTMLTEFATLLAITLLVGGIGTWFNLHPLVSAALAVTFTYIGMVALGQLAEKALARRVEQIVEGLGK
jgi:hypothetical protein